MPRRRGLVTAALLSLTALPLSVIPADAAVGGDRLIEVFTGSNLIGLHNYPADTLVHIEVLRQGIVIGETTKRTDATGLIELNHVGGTDCFDGPTSPDVVPGDTIRASFDGLTTPDTSLVRGIWIDEPQFGVPDDTHITVTGRVSVSGATAVDRVGDVLELRINKDTTWDVNSREGRRDRREDINGSVRADGTFRHVLAASAQDVKEAAASSETVLEWSAAAAGAEEAEPSEITVAEPAGGGEAIDCPPLQQGPTAPALLASLDSARKGDHITNRSGSLTFRGLAGPDADDMTVEPGANAEVELLVDGAARATATVGANAVYEFTVTLPPRARAYSVMARAKDPGEAPTFDSPVRLVRIDTAAPSLVLRRAAPNPLRLRGPERLQAVYRVGEPALLGARVQRRLATGVRTVNTFAPRQTRRAGLVEYNWGGKTEIRRDVRPGRYQLVLTAADAAGNRSTHVHRFRVVR